jgi:SAM-dependent methyltransferase
MSFHDVVVLATVAIGVPFALYNLFHYVLFLLVTHPGSARKIGHCLNEFEQRQLVEWRPSRDDFLKHDDEQRTYDDVFGTYRGEQDNYSSCVFPRTLFANPYDADFVLLALRDGMRILELGCGSGAAANFFASRCDVEIVCVTNSNVQAEICQRKFVQFGGRVRVMVADFDALDLPENSFDAICAFESIGYSKDVDAWLKCCHRMLKPGGKLLIRSPASLENCRREQDYRNVTAFFDNWRYNFVGANLLVNRLRHIGFGSIRCRQLPFWAWGLTWNFIQHVLLWKFRLKMRTMVDMERIIWRTSKAFIFGNAYNTVLAVKGGEQDVPSLSEPTVMSSVGKA